MDPNACLKRFVDACRDDDREEAMAAIDDLRDWIAAGGFLPRQYRLAESGGHIGETAETMIIAALPRGQMTSPVHSVLIRPYLGGQKRIQLTRADQPDRHSPPGHGDIVREFCTYSLAVALVAQAMLGAADDPEALARTWERPWNCEAPGYGRIRLDHGTAGRPEFRGVTPELSIGKQLIAAAEP